MGNKFSRRRSHIDDRFTRPQGLYQHKDIDYKRLRRSIIDAKLAPCYAGAEDAANDLEECPICFLHYPSLNRSKCCTKEICTECFLQVKVPNAARPVQCPFCKTPNYAVDYKGAKTQEEKGFEQAEEQKVIEAKIRIRLQQEIEDQEARLQRQEQPPEEESPPPADSTQEQNRGRDAAPAATSFPVFPGSAYTEARPGEQHPASESWNTWSNVDSTAIGYPQPDFFTFHPTRSDLESPWHRGSQREFGRHNPLSSSSALSERNLSLFNSRRRGAISGEPGQGPGAAYPSYNREEDFDLDLEDIMVMEAIWLSIQEQGAQRAPENTSETALSSPFGGLQYEIQEVPPLTPLETSAEGRGGRRGSVTGGFASAIAALAERQVAGSASSEEQQISESDSESTHSAGDVQAEAQSAEEHASSVSGTGSDVAGFSEDAGKAHASKVQVAETAEAAARAGSVENSHSNNNSSNRNMIDSSETAGDYVEATTDMLIEQGLDSAEAGTSFCSSAPSASAAAAGAAAADSAGSRQVLPESFEEQMMLAMALSLAEAQAQAKCCKA